VIGVLNTKFQSFVVKQDHKALGWYNTAHNTHCRKCNKR